MQAESFSLTLKLDPTACSLAVFRKEKRSLPACCRGFVISTPARNVSGLDASATALQTLPFLCSSDSHLGASSPVAPANFPLSDLLRHENSGTIGPWQVIPRIQIPS